MPFSHRREVALCEICETRREKDKPLQGDGGCIIRDAGTGWHGLHSPSVALQQYNPNHRTPETLLQEGRCVCSNCIIDGTTRHALQSFWTEKPAMPIWILGFGRFALSLRTTIYGKEM